MKSLIKRFAELQAELEQVKLELKKQYPDDGEYIAQGYKLKVTTVEGMRTDYSSFLKDNKLVIPTEYKHKTSAYKRLTVKHI